MGNYGRKLNRFPAIRKNKRLKIVGFTKVVGCLEYTKAHQSLVNVFLNNTAQNFPMTFIEKINIRIKVLIFSPELFYECKG